MKTWTLTGMDETDKKKVVYTYKTESGEAISFNMHPTRAFVFQLVIAVPIVTKREFTKICDEFVRKGVKQRSFAGGFKEAISELVIN